MGRAGGESPCRGGGEVRAAGRGGVRAEGDIRLTTPEANFRMGDVAVRILGGGEPGDGVVVTLLVPAEAVHISYRTGAIPIPDSGPLVVGGVRDTIARLQATPDRRHLLGPAPSARLEIMGKERTNDVDRFRRGGP